MAKKNKNLKTLADFVFYCAGHPEQRFWQALRNWSGHNFVLISDVNSYTWLDLNRVTDTFYWSGKEK